MKSQLKKHEGAMKVKLTIASFGATQTNRKKQSTTSIRKRFLINHLLAHANLHKMGKNQINLEANVKNTFG